MDEIDILYIRLEMIADLKNLVMLIDPTTEDISDVDQEN